MAKPHRRTPCLAAAAGFAGSTLAYSDFLLYATAAALVFPKPFFPSGNPAIATLASFVPDDGSSHSSPTEQKTRNDLLARDERIRRRWSQTRRAVGLDSSPWRCHG